MTLRYAWVRRLRIVAVALLAAALVAFGVAAFAMMGDAPSTSPSAADETTSTADPGLPATNAGADHTTTPTGGDHTTTTEPGAVTTTPGGAAPGCTVTLQPGDDVGGAVRAAQGGDTICLGDGRFGDVVVDGSEFERSSYVTLVSLRPLAAVVDSIRLDAVSYLRMESLTVVGKIRNGEDASSHVQIVGSDINGILIDAPTIKASDFGPSDWLIEHNDIRSCDSFCIALLSADPERYQPISDVVIRGNKIGPMGDGEDAIRLHNWNGVVVEDNEVFGVLENGQHNDCLQSVWGGQHLRFTGNYLHDNNCQVFFLKDGYVEDVTFSDNLSIRNRAGEAQVSAKVYPTGGFVMSNNTLWDGSPFYLRSRPHGGKFPTGPIADYEITNNVFGSFIPYDDDQSDNNRAGVFTDPSLMLENQNVFAAGWTWVPDHIGPQSVVDEAPPFIAMSADSDEDTSFGDWRLEGPVNGSGATFTAGISWELAGRLFGIDARD